MTVTGIHHAGRTVRNMEKSLTFYRDLLGLQTVDDDRLSGEAVSEMIGLPAADLRAVMLSVDGRTPLVELIEYTSPPSRELRGDEAPSDVGNMHFCFLVESMSAAYDRLSRAGVAFAGEPMCADAGVFAGQWSAYCYDPDRLIVELWSHNK